MTAAALFFADKYLTRVALSGLLAIAVWTTPIPAHGACTPSRLGGTIVGRNIVAALHGNKPVTTTADVGMGKTLRVTYDISDRREGVIQIANLILLAATSEKTPVRMYEGSLDVDLVPSSGEYCDLLVSGILERYEDRSRTPRIETLIILYGYDSVSGRFIKRYQRSDFRVEIADDVPVR